VSANDLNQQPINFSGQSYKNNIQGNGGNDQKRFMQVKVILINFMI